MPRSTKNANDSTTLTSCTNLSSEWCIYNARPEKQRRAVLIVLPFVGVKGSGSKYAAITANNLSSKGSSCKAHEKPSAQHTKRM